MAGRCVLRGKLVETEELPVQRRCLGRFGQPARHDLDAFRRDPDAAPRPERED